MNHRQILHPLGLVAMVIGASMAGSLPWSMALFGGDWETERVGFFGLVLSMLLAFGVGAALCFFGKKSDHPLLRKESMAVVPISWVLAILLGALPYIFSGTQMGLDRPMGWPDAIFESASGYTTTGATVLSELENPLLVPRTILFWRATTHFLGGLGIMVLFVVVLGQGALGKTIMNIEKGSGSATPHARMRALALSLAGVYVGLIVVESLILMMLGLSTFDAICHSFSTLATGGFSTYNASVGHFAAESGLNGPLIEGVIILFMILAGSNFLLLFLAFTGEPKRLFADIEWRTYIGIAAIATGIIFLAGMMRNDFDPYGTSDLPIVCGSLGPESLPPESLGWADALRQSTFQTVSILTSTGFCTDEYEKWNSLSLLVILFLMFAGGCVGSTGGGTKILRNIVAWQTVRHETERVYRPNVIRSMKIGGVPLDKNVAHTMLTFLLLFVASVFFITFLVLLIEPDMAWTAAGLQKEDKMIDVFSASLSMHSNVGPGLGLVGARQNYGFFTPLTKLIFSWGMLLGRLELYLPLMLFSWSFWRGR